MKTKLSIFLLCLCMGALSQVPDTETFSMFDVTSEISGTGAVSRIDRVFKSGDSNDCTFTCNGHSETMTWVSNPNLTVQDFILNHGSDFGSVSLQYDSYGAFTVTANTPGVDFGETTISGTGNTVTNITPNYSGASISDFLSCFTYANTEKFDRWYYPNYRISGPHFNVTNSLLNFRNYGAALRPPIYFLPRGITENSISWYWLDNAHDEQGYMIQRSPNGVNNWTTVETTSANIERFNDTGLSPSTVYYYRIRAFNGSSYSAWVTGSAQTTTFNDEAWYLPPQEEVEKMFANLKAYGVGVFSSGIYWTSSETSVGTSYAIGVSFSGVPGPIVVDKSNQLYVRAARNFSASYGAYSLRSTGPAGGLIFYIQAQSDGTYRYYECAASDQASLQSWSNITNTRCGGTFPNIGTGLNNISQIMNQTGHTSSAAKLCDDLN